MLRYILIILVMLLGYFVTEAQQMYLVKSNCSSKWKANSKGKSAGQLSSGDTIKEYYRDQNWVIFIDKDQKKKFVRVEYLYPLENRVIPVANIEQVKKEDKPDMTEWSFLYLLSVTAVKFLIGLGCLLVILLIIHYLF